MKRVAVGLCGLIFGLIAIAGFHLEPDDRDLRQLLRKQGLPTGFEASAVGKLPGQWLVAGEGYAADVVSWDASEGKKAARLIDLTEDRSNEGEVAMVLEGALLAGKIVEVDAKLKVLSAQEASMVVRIERLRGDSATWTAKAPIGGWKPTRVAIRIPEDVKQVKIGFRASGGDILVDHVRLSVSRDR